MRCYNKLIQLQSIQERYAYLRIGGQVGKETFGVERYLNQIFYHSKEYDLLRKDCLIRDSDGDNILELACPGFPINGRVYLHHITPITLYDITNKTDLLLDPDNVVCCSKMMHDAIHYGDDSYVQSLLYSPRRPNDTSPWRQKEMIK